MNSSAGDDACLARNRLFGVSDDERLDEIAFHLAAQHMKILRGGGEIADLDVVLGARLQEALERALECSGPWPS